MQTPEQIVSEVLEPGETILWSGKPDVKIGVRGKSQRKSNIIFTMILSAVVGTWVYQKYGAQWSEGSPEFADVLTLVQQEVMAQQFSPVAIAVVGLIALPFLLRVFGLSLGSRLKQHYQNQTYAITNRRLLVLEKGKLLKTDDGHASYKPGDVVNLQLRELTEGYGDVIFARNRPRTRGSSSSAPSRVRAEHRYIGFKAQPNPKDLIRRIEAWQRDAAYESGKVLAGFLNADATDTSDDVTRVIENEALGLRLKAPQVWKVEVRKKKHPFGKTFIDIEKWKDIDEADDWNVVRITGPKLYQIMIEVFQTPPLANYEELSAGGLIAKLAGEISDSNANLEMAGLTGFMIERKTDLGTSHESGAAVLDGGTLRSKTIVLQEPDRQVVINVASAEDTSRDKEVIDRILETIRFG